jgi:hypothetical protein
MDKIFLKRFGPAHASMLAYSCSCSQARGLAQGWYQGNTKLSIPTLTSIPAFSKFMLSIIELDPTLQNVEVISLGFIISCMLGHMVIRVYGFVF